MQLKVLQETVCENTGMVIPKGIIIESVWDARRGSYVGKIGEHLVSVPYDNGGIILEDETE